MNKAVVLIPNSRCVYLQSLCFDLRAWPLPFKDLHVFNLSWPGPHTSVAWAPPSCTSGVYSARILNSRRTNDSDEWCYKFSGVSEPLLTAPEEDRQSKVRSARWQRGQSHVADLLKYTDTVLVYQSLMCCLSNTQIYHESGWWPSFLGSILQYHDNSSGTRKV